MGEAGGQKGTEYRPTAKQQKLLDVLLDPQNRGITITDACALAGCSRKVYYNAIKNEEFVKLYKDQSFDLIKAALGQVINTFIEKAKEGSYQHGEAILDMAGVYSKNTKIQLDGNLGVRIVDDIDGD